ncbi:polysaccharide biosynthesis tyrosine autokinase [Flexibacter flexilis]|uniref:polysaccharide biosynthesis tyrosine autokinase n=1 Tax=Flexibacter flexilis TaxID=998 RepID=UPI0015A5DA2F|nr:tyrosine-protein kinase [Flexibacter flexilis]
MSTFQQQEDEGFDFKALLFKIYDIWYYVLFSVLIALVASYIYNKYLVPTYSVSTSVMFKSQQKRSFDLEALIDEEGISLGGGGGMDNELAKLTSAQMVEQVIDSLKLNVSYFAQGQLSRLELYKDAPYVVTTDFEQIPSVLVNKLLYYEPVSNNEYLLVDSENLVFNHITSTFVERETLPKNQAMFLGHKYAMDSSFLLIQPNLVVPKQLGEKTRNCFIIHDKVKLSEKIAATLLIERTKKGGNLINISIKGPHIQKIVDIINTLMAIYAVNDMRERNLSLSNTVNFIDDQLAQVSTILKSTEGELDGFRKFNKSMSVSQMSAEAFSELKGFDKEKEHLKTRQQYYLYLKKYLSGNNPIDQIVAPAMLGIDEPLMTNLINELLSVSSKLREKKFYQNDDNKPIISYKQKIVFLRQQILEVVENDLRMLSLQLHNADENYKEAESQILSLPDKERQQLSIERRLKINDNIYTFLLQKRTEIGMTKAGTTPNVNVISTAKPQNATIVGMQKVQIYAIAALAGLLFPIVVVVLMMLLNDKLQSKKDVERISRIPILGLIGHNTRGDYLVVNDNPKSVITEAFRSIRLNLTYFAPDKKHKVIGVTSSVSGEGKTFLSMNLGAVFALAGKKTVVIMADLRKPKYEVELGLDLSKGLSTYLTGQSTYDESVQITKFSNLYVLPAGPIPPNPAETLGLPAMEELINRLREDYECVIIDTPPLGLLADWFILSPFIDAGVYIVRHNYTRKSFLKKINELYVEKKVKNISIVINDIGKKMAGYGYGYTSYGYDYGYSYFEKPATWYQKLFGLFSKKRKK